MFRPVHRNLLLIFILIVPFALLACRDGRAPASTVEIVGGTSLVTDIVDDISDLRAASYTLLPGTSCPSQFDMKPLDIAKLQRAEIILLQPWQLHLANIRRTLEAAQVPEPKVRLIDVPGNWMTPEAQIEAVEANLAVLMEYAPQSVSRERAVARITHIEEAAAKARAALPPETTAALPVLCHEMQRPFLAWAGFPVAATFNRPEDWSVADTEKMLRTGREAGVALIVDNVQSGGTTMSAALARDMGAVQVVLSNFPGGFPDTPTWQAAFEHNLARLIRAVKDSSAS